MLRCKNPLLVIATERFPSAPLKGEHPAIFHVDVNGNVVPK
jgi:hypothetical protein